MEQYIQAVATVLSLVNPAMCGVIFGGGEANRPKKARVADATKAAFAIFVILELAALFGQRLLGLFGLSLEVFSVAGGLVLVWMGFSMLGGAAKPATSDHAQAAGNSPSLTPLILFAASPGTITGVITLSISHSHSTVPITAIVAVAVAILLTWVVMIVLPAGKSGGGGPGLVRSTIQAFMGLIVMAMGVQFGLNGLSAFIQGMS